MKKGRLIALTVERFKSYKGSTRIELAPLTIVVGRNNSGKSTLIQALLLLKQTLAEVRPEVPLRLDGLVEALSLRELTNGWPPANGRIEGPTIEVEWDSDVDIDEALAESRNPDRANLAKHTVKWLEHITGVCTVRTRLRIQTEEVDGSARISKLTLEAINPEYTKVVIQPHEDPSVSWENYSASKLVAEVEHFIPYISLKGSPGPRTKERAYRNGFLFLFAQPLQALKSILNELQYLGSSRLPSPSLFKIATTAPSEIGVSGELAAQLLHRRQNDLVHFAELLNIDAPILPTEVRAFPLVEAVNIMFASLGVHAPLKVEEIQDVGFRLLFGSASLSHVGRGLGYLLPLIELGMIADPLRFVGQEGSMSSIEYSRLSPSYAHIALEEPEAHLHPKIASQLAHWLVSLAVANRRLIVETHSDHLVRRLRGLVARAGKGSDLEKWLLKNVVILNVEQDLEGISIVTSSHLTRDGGVGDVWPADFMDEATDEESAIYYANLDKTTGAQIGSTLTWNDKEEPEAEAIP
jgi:predicted ATPase